MHRGAQRSPGKPLRAQECPGEPRRVQENPGEPKRWRLGGGREGGNLRLRVSLRCHAVLDVAVMFLYNGHFQFYDFALFLSFHGKGGSRLCSSLLRLSDAASETMLFE